jgi:hypothetical protein
MAESHAASVSTGPVRYPSRAWFHRLLVPLVFLACLAALGIGPAAASGDAGEQPRPGPGTAELSRSAVPGLGGMSAARSEDPRSMPSPGEPQRVVGADAAPGGSAVQRAEPGLPAVLGAAAPAGRDRAATTGDDRRAGTDTGWPPLGRGPPHHPAS